MLTFIVRLRSSNRRQVFLFSHDVTHEMQSVLQVVHASAAAECDVTFHRNRSKVRIFFGLHANRGEPHVIAGGTAHGRRREKTEVLRTRLHRSHRLLRTRLLLFVRRIKTKTSTSGLDPRQELADDVMREADAAERHAI